MAASLPDPSLLSPIGRFVGEVLREWREARGWNRARLARASGIWHTTIEDLELGRSGGRTDSLDRLCAALDHDIAALFAEAHRRRCREPSEAPSPSSPPAAPWRARPT